MELQELLEQLAKELEDATHLYKVDYARGYEAALAEIKRRCRRDGLIPPLPEN